MEGVLNWPASQNIKEVQKFLGLANYYRRFIRDFARLAVCYESPKKEQVSHAFKHLVTNIKSYNTDKI